MLVCVWANCCNWVHNHKPERSTRGTRRSKTRTDRSATCSLRNVNICCHNWRAEQPSVAIFTNTLWLCNTCTQFYGPNFAFLPQKVGNENQAWQTRWEQSYACFTEPYKERPCPVLSSCSVSSSCSYPGTPPQKSTETTGSPFIQTIRANQYSASAHGSCL